MEKEQANPVDCAHLRAGRNDDAIPYQCAQQWSDAWKQKYPNGPSSFLFTREEVEAILNEGGSHVRVALGINEAAEVGSIDYYKMLLIGVNINITKKDGKITYTDENLLGPDNTVQDFAKPCPPYCPNTFQVTI